MFVLKEDGSLIPMKATQFKLEEDFQRLLELPPELLAGDLIDSEEPRRWVLVTREIAIPSEADGIGWWSADHLFLDQDGIPTIVEVKRQTDTRLRREVVGQMLDYAANAVAYLPVAEIRSRFERTCEKKGTEPDQELQARLGQGIDAEKFWQQVKTNLEAQRIRLLRQDWLERLNGIGLFLQADCIEKYPGVPLAFLALEERQQNFLQVMDWFKAELQIKA